MQHDTGSMAWGSARLCACTSSFNALTGPILTSIDMIPDPRRSRFRIPGMLEARLSALKNLVTGREHEVHMIFPTEGGSGMTGMRRPKPCRPRMETSRPLPQPEWLLCLTRVDQSAAAGGRGTVGRRSSGAVSIKATRHNQKEGTPWLGP
jgi:hypothetical protein